MKALLACINSPTIGVCDCCGEPIYDPAHQLARKICATISAAPGANAQAIYDEIVQHIEEAFGELLILADEFDWAIGSEVQAVN